MKNKLAMLSVVSLALAFGPASANEGGLTKGEMVEAQCDALASELKSIQSQLPMKVDYMTELTGMSVMRLTGSCIININYVFEEDTFINEMISGSKGSWNEEQAIDFAKSEQGQEILEDIYRDSAKQGFQAAKDEFPELVININIFSDGLNLKQIMFQL